MKLWKSPVFYFGIILLLAVAAALSAPYVVDWGKYRTAMESYGRKLTGREVSVDGPIAVRLFPWPKLVLDDVKVANPAGAADKHFLKAERIDVRVTLAGLFNGEIQVETVDIIKPVISLERMAAGQWTWRMTPSTGVVRSRLLDHVKLDKVTIEDGTLRLKDGRRGGAAEVANVDAVLSAPDIAGPWRARGTAVYRDQPFAVSAGTGSWDASKPLRLAARISPAEGSGIVYDFDGENSGDALSGVLRIEQAIVEGGKGDAEGTVRPLAMSAKVEADFNEIKLNEIAIAARDEEQGGDLLSGDAHIALGAVIGVTANLTASKFNLDAVAGAKAKALWREGGALMLLSDVLAALPEGIDGKGTLRVTSLIAGNDRLQNVLLSAAITQEAIKINELSAGLPGQTAAKLKGIFISAGGGPQLAGDLEIDSADMRSLVSWVWPEKKDDLIRIWSGNRGRLKLATRFDAAPNKLRLSNAGFQIDESTGAGTFAYAAAPQPKADLKLDASLVDIDSYIPAGFAAVSSDGKQSFAAAAALLSALVGPTDIDVSFKAQRLLLNGVAAKDAVVDVASSADGLVLRRVAVGDVSGASLAVTGLVTHEGGQLSGAIDSKVQAKDPRGLLRLIGLAPGGRAPAWFAPLGDTDVQISAQLAPESGAQSGKFEISGKSGQLELAGAIGLSNGLDLSTARIAASGEIKSASSAAVLQLAGLAPVVVEDAPGSLSVTLSGSLANGVRSDVQADLLGAKLQFRGVATGTSSEPKLAGRVALAAERPQALFLSLGLAAAEQRLFSAEADLSYDKGALSLSGLRGVSSSAPFGGDIKISKDRKLSGSLDLPHIHLGALLAQLYLPWNGEPADAEGPFAAQLPFGLQGEIWIKPQTLTVFDGFDVPGSQIGLTAGSQEIRLAVFGKTQGGDNVALDLNSKPAPGGRSFEGKLTVPIDLAGRLKAADGKPVAAGVLLLDGGFSGAGRSPASVLASLNGTGSYKLRDVSLGELQPEGFASRIAEAKSPADVDAALAALLSGKSLAVGDTAGTITMQDGVVSFLPVKLQTPTADAVIKPLAELGSGQIDIGIALQLKEIPGLPGLEVAYAGKPMELKRSVDSAALQSHLGMEVLQRGVDELERLQGEQKRLAALEEQARIEDAARLAAYEDKRRELRQRQREVRVHRRLREQEAQRFEIEKKAREQAARSATARAQESPRRARPASRKPEPPLGPLVIVPPADPPPQPVQPKKPPPKTLFDFLNQL